MKEKEKRLFKKKSKYNCLNHFTKTTIYIYYLHVCIVSDWWFLSEPAKRPLLEHSSNKCNCFNMKQRRKKKLYLQIKLNFLLI